MNITSRQLKAFVLTARHRSFSRAAEEFCITQSGMSVLVRELEAQLGFRLFERTTRTVKLTPFGEKFLPTAQGSLLELEAVAAAIGRTASAANGEIAIGATPPVASDVLPAAIAAYLPRDPALQIRLVDAESRHLIELLQAGEIDIALCAYHRVAPDLMRIPLIDFSLMLISGEGDGVDLPLQARWSQVAQRRLIGFPPDNPIQQRVNEHLLHAGRRRPPDVVCNLLETQLAMVEAGAGVAVMPTLAVSSCRKRKVRIHALADPVVSGSLDWIASRGRPLPLAADSFSAFLKQFLSTTRHPLPDDGGAECLGRIMRDGAPGVALEGE
jgi:DNA-binding transcriptional LysR family regulator